MLIEFTVGNFRSFKDTARFSMVAANTKARDPKINEGNTIEIDKKLTLLTSAAIYGANASGKSNLIKALFFMRNFSLTSSNLTQVDEEINVAPFLLNTTTEKQPTFFEVIFLKKGIPYRYGFEITKNQVVSEWLFYSPRRQEVKLFVRDENGINISREFKGDKSTKKVTRPNALFLSVAAQFNSETAKKVLSWFRALGVISGLDDVAYGGYSAEKFSEMGDYREKMLHLIKDSDVDINNIITEKRKIHEGLPQDMPKELRDFVLSQSKGDDEILSLKTSHLQRNSKGETVAEKLFDLNEESQGTQKLIHMSGPIIDTLINGKVLIIDEIEARLHTHLTKKIIKLFNSKSTNPKNAQLIFATHDTNLLSNKLFRRDQIWFIEKDQSCSSHLYSLAEIKVDEGKVRNDASFEEDYLQGRYGALPLLGELRQIFIDPAEQV